MFRSGTAVMGISAHDGGLLRSEDSGKTWQALSNPNLLDLAMDPTDPSMIVGTTQTSLVRSIDGEPGALSVRGNEIALLAGSTVFYSGDGGATFRPRIIGVMGH